VQRGSHDIASELDMQAECGEAFGHQAGGAEFGQSKFRMLVQIPQAP
jgi:hypothetical protein